MARTRTNRRKASKLLGAAAWLAVALSAVMLMLDRSIPDFARRRLERRLSSGLVAVSMDAASFNIFNGLTFRNVKVFRKGVFAPPLATSGESRLRIKPSLSRPPNLWISSAYFNNLYVASVDDWLALAGIEEDAEDEDIDFAALDEIFRELFGEGGGPFAAAHVVIENARVLEVNARFSEFDAEVSGEGLILKNISLVPDAPGYLEMLKGRISLAPADGEFTAMLSGTVTPEVVRDLTISLGGDTVARIYDRISGIQTPFSAVGEIALRQQASGQVFDVRLTLSGNDFSYRKVPVKSLKMGLQWLTDSGNDTDSGRRLVISPLDATLEDGKFALRLAWYPKLHASDIYSKATLRPDRIAALAGTELPGLVTNLTFATPPRVEMSGRVVHNADGLDVVSGTLSSSKAVVRGVGFDDVAADWGFDEPAGKAWIHGLRARCCDGPVEASLDIFATNDIPFIATFSAQNVKTDPLRKIFDKGAPESDGRLSVKGEIRGNLATNTLASLSGTATAKLRGAAITRIPLFAGLTDFLARNVAGVDLLVMQSDSDMELSVTNGLVTVDRLTVDGNMLSIVSRGKWRIDSPDLPVEGVAQVRFFHSRSVMGFLARIVTIPVSKLMEFRVYGPINKAKWEYIGLIDRIAEATFWPRGDATERKDGPGGE